MERSLYCYIVSLHMLTNTNKTALTIIQVARKVLFPSCLIGFIPLSQIKIWFIPGKRQNKASGKGELISGNHYQNYFKKKYNLEKIFKRITYNHSLSQSQQQMEATDIQEEEIRMSINLSYIKGSSEKLQRILRSHKIRSTFYTILNALCVNSFENLKVEQLQKIKTVSFMKLTVVSAKQSNSVNLNSL